MAHAPIKTTITPEWVRAQKDAEDGIMSVGGLAHRVNSLAPAASPEPGRLTLAKFVELARRERNLSPGDLAARAGVGLVEVVALERPDWPRPSVRAIESIAAALEVAAAPLLKLGGLGHTEDQNLAEVAVEFAARLEPVKPLEPQELDALSWLRGRALTPSAETTKAG